MTRSFALCVAVSIFLLTGCGSGDRGDREPAKGQDPQSRWPETGSFSYRASDGTCVTEKSFERKADFCLTLQKRHANNSCAVNERHDQYTRACGNDFEETELPAPSWDGVDAHLGKSCKTARSGVEIFDRLGEFCAFLKDESLHQGCHWQSRHEEFDRSHCVGSFSDEPRGVEPSPKPSVSPSPQPSSSPSPAPNNEPKIVRELRAEGIEVKTHSDHYPIPGEKPFSERLKVFWGVLESVKAEILARKSSIKMIDVTIYTLLDTEDSRLWVDVDFTTQDFLEYLKLLDRRVALESALGFRIDFSIEVYRSGEFEPFKKRLAYLEANLQRLAQWKVAVKLLEVGEYTRYWLGQRKLTVHGDQFEKDLQLYLVELEPVIEFLAMMDKLGIEVEESLELEKDWKQSRIFLRELLELKAPLSELKKLGVLDTIELADYRDENYFSLSSRELSPAYYGKGFKLIDSVINKLASQYRISAELGVPVETSLDLDEDYLETMLRLEARLSVIRGKKKGSIDEIQLSYESSYSSETLLIGFEGTLADLDKVLAQIP